jgi:tetratricopeptide (TPR) repeat protein
LPVGGGADSYANANASGRFRAGETGDDATEARTGSSNAFPEDTSNVPVVSTNPNDAERIANPDGGQPMALPGVDHDPVRSPDDASATEEDAPGDNSSSSSAGMDKLLPKPGDDEPDKKKKLGAKEPTKVEAASEDISVGDYYLQTKNWKAALSRFESAMVLAPDNPEVFWGLAESERHLGDFAGARKYYQTVLDYDPDSKHGKDARKALKDPEIANAQAKAPVN